MKTFSHIHSLLILIAVVASFSMVSYSDTDDLRIEKIVQQLHDFNEQCRQQKIHIQTDKDIYLAGETIWLKTYLLEASTLQPDSFSKDIYIELLNMNQKAVNYLILKNKNGISDGYLLLRDTLLEGTYQIRAYTNWMRNFESSFFFHKTITIKNPNYENVVTREKLKEIKQFNKALHTMDHNFTVNFFPEGGNLIIGKQSIVAFKAETNLGTPLDIKGIVVDNHGTQVADFQSIHDGMGIFKFTPSADAKYTAKVTFVNGKTLKYSLPKAIPKGVVMRTDITKDKIRINIESTRPISENIASNEVIIVAQSRGIITYISKGEVRDKPVISEIPKDKFPAGIAQITLFDNRCEPLCERLVFIESRYPATEKIVSLTQKAIGDSIFCKITLDKTVSGASKGEIAFSAVEDIPGPGTENILTDLLLTSDLKGLIQNPQYYFDPSNPDAMKHLDLVMLTNGWRRFVWKKVMTGEFPTILYPKTGGIAIDGRITHDFFNIPVSGSKVILSIQKTYNDKFETLTDSRGHFVFPAMEYEDTIDVKIEAFKPNGGKNVQIILGDTLTPVINTAPYPSFFNEEYDKKKMKINNWRENLEYKRKSREKPKDDNEITRIYDNASNSLLVGNDVVSYSNILQYMQGRIPGVIISGNRVIIRGVGTLYGSTDPLFLLDGVPIGASSVSSINPSDIYKIDVLKGPDASIYGIEGANGVIAFYSKRGHFMRRGVIEFQMLGYQKTREFYNPPYDTWTYKPENYGVPKTVYWRSNITINSDGETTIKFKKKLPVEKMIFTLEGITDSGEILYLKTKN